MHLAWVRPILEDCRVSLVKPVVGLYGEPRHFLDHVVPLRRVIGAPRRQLLVHVFTLTVCFDR